MKATCLVLATASLALYRSTPADACSPPVCWPAAFIPGNHARIPANVPGLFWRPMSGFGATADPRNLLLVRTAAPKNPVAFTAMPYADGDYLLVPAAPLVEGDYVLVDRNTCTETGERGPEVAFTVGPEARLPTDLGTLIAAAPSIIKLELETRIGSCSSPATVAETSFELTPSVEAATWFDALHFETLVDGYPWHYQTALNVPVPPGESQTGRGRDRVFAVCSSQDKTVTGLPAGPHVVTMRATLPGLKSVMGSSTLDVTLRCDAAPPPPNNPPMPVDPPNDPQDERHGGGCSAGGSGAAPGLSLALLALARARTRRRPR